MNTLVDTNALLYAVIARSVIAVLILGIAAVALYTGAVLLRRSFDSSGDSGDGKTAALRRLSEDTWLPRGTYIKNSDQDWRFTRLHKDMWVGRGTLAMLAGADADRQKVLGNTGIAVMLSSLLWIWLSYIVSPLHTEEMREELATSQEYKLHTRLAEMTANLGELQSATDAVQGRLQQLQSVTEDNHPKAGELLAGLARAEEKLALLSEQMNAVRQDSGQLNVLNQAQQENARNFSAAWDKTRQQLVEAKSDFALLREQLAALNGHAASAEAVDKLFTSAEQTRSRIDAVQAELAALRQESSEARTADPSAALAQTDSRIAAIHTELSALRGENTQAHAADAQTGHAVMRGLQQNQRDLDGIKNGLAFLETGVADIRRRTEIPPAPGGAEIQDSNGTARQLEQVRTDLASVKTALNDLRQAVELSALPQPALLPEQDDENRFHSEVLRNLDELEQRLQTREQASAELHKALAAHDQKPVALPEIRVGLMTLEQSINGLRHEMKNIQSELQSRNTRPAMMLTAANLSKPEIIEEGPPVLPLSLAEADRRNLQSVLQVLANPVVRALTAPQSPTIKDWGKYADVQVAFRSGSHDRPEDFTALRALGEALQLPPFKEREILIRGYTDNVGEAANNLNLSYKRAAFVKDYLIEHYGLDSNKVTIEGRGEDSPVASNDTPGGRAKNRRIRVAIR